MKQPKNGRAGLGLLFAISFLAACSIAYAAPDPAEMAEALPQITLPAPEDPAHRAYLGVTGPEEFAISDIDAQIVIIEIFNMYCPHCQKQAPTVNQVYSRIRQSARLHPKVKLIGIGVGNTAYEVEVFKNRYSIAFPLFPDPDARLFDKLGRFGTPYFIGLERKPSGGHRVFYNAAGGAPDGETLLRNILAPSGLAF
jgi:peroxiredoxin